MARSKKEDVSKTNAMRELERAGVPYVCRLYEVEDEIAVGVGMRVAEATGVDPDSALKTLVCVSPKKTYSVFCIPVASELDLKKAARAASEKSLALLNWRDLPLVTGYVRGGCSPVGMKKAYPTYIDETAQLFDLISISGGKIGVQLTLSPEDLLGFCNAADADLVEE